MSALSKRQQARNEKTLQELLKVPGNNVCADCQARNPGWASWSLGIFICMRCAALHRKMGTHISKVKSLSMDSWSSDQVENMKRTGNVASNRIYNPQNAKPPIPMDVDEADSAMERFIRQKYQDRSLGGPPAERHNTGSSASDDHPPPLPPKTGLKFGLRSASSIFPLSHKARREAAETPTSPPRSNKQSRVFGTSVAGDRDDIDGKLAQLRDMGFRDEKKNATILKGLGGNLEKTIEALVRLGDVSGASAGNGPSRVDEPATTTRARTPLNAPLGLTIERTRDLPSPNQRSMNPFDKLDHPLPPPPQTSHSTGSLPQTAPQSPLNTNNPFNAAVSTNPFGLAPSQSQYSLNQAFQNMSVSQSAPSAPLFPHHTGGAIGSHSQHQLYQQSSMTPPVPSIPQQYHPPVIYENAVSQPVSAPNNYNPFFQQPQQQQQQAPQPPTINTGYPFASSSAQQQQAHTQPFFHSPIEQSPQQQQQYPPAFYDGSAQQTQASQPAPSLNPFLNNLQASSQNSQAPYGYQPLQQQLQPQAQYQQFRQQTYPLMPQQTGRVDKHSILDLYNHPQLAPTPPQPFQSAGQGQYGAGQAAAAAPVSQQMPQQSPFQQPQRQQQMQQQPAPSPGNPLATQMASSRNPFMTSGSGVGGGMAAAPMPSYGGGGVTSATGAGIRHVSQESISIDSGSWHTGRHSPDAFASLSSRSIT
ncbi:hypothetical protein F5884DRAFT_850114 [Xylogone sp. PMI_703]|nr:hypothetical protein F5884DRAFT_850114 [Xylogone sp. PMI_703]